jgi:AcrR family transcriptional regulator
MDRPRIREDRRRAALERMADHLLREGLAGASLRSLAAAAGTSDRMLLYYFADKDEILAETLARLAGRLAAVLDAAAPAGGRLSYPDLLSEVWATLRSPEVEPYFRVWFELVAGARDGGGVLRPVARRIAEGYVDWIADRLLAADGSPARAQAALLFATVEGAALLAAVGRADDADAAIAAATGGTGRQERRGRREA